MAKRRENRRVHNRMQDTLEIGRDHLIEFVFRDTTNLAGKMADRVAETCRMVRDLTGQREGSRAARG